jgi:hypothetical protein
MGMKETEGSLRAYFLVAGVLAALLSLRDYSEVSKVIGLLPGDMKFALYFEIVGRLLLGCAFIVAGIKLKSALVTGAGWIKKMLVASGVFMFADGAILTAVFGSAVMEYRTGIVGAVIGFLITVYLYRSVARLAAEAAARAGIAPPPPTAKVV